MINTGRIRATLATPSASFDNCRNRLISKSETFGRSHSHRSAADGTGSYHLIKSVTSIVTRDGTKSDRGTSTEELGYVKKY
jgi:hypothetical protein